MGVLAVDQAAVGHPGSGPSLRHSAILLRLIGDDEALDVAPLPTTKPILGPGRLSAWLSCETVPHMATRLKLLIRSNTPPAPRRRHSRSRVDALRAGGPELRRSRRR